MSFFCCARLPFGVNPVQHLSNFSVFPNDKIKIACFLHVEAQRMGGVPAGDVADGEEKDEEGLPEPPPEPVASSSSSAAPALGASSSSSAAPAPEPPPEPVDKKAELLKRLVGLRLAYKAPPGK